MSIAIEQQIKDILQELGYILYCIENVSENYENIYRINILKKDENVSLDDCTKAHKALYPLLDENNITDKYTVQISSPGIQRVLKEPWHYALCIDKKIKIKTTQKRMTGILKSSDKNKIQLLLKDDELVDIDYIDIKVAKLSLEQD